MKGQSRLADHGPDVPDEIWGETAWHYDEPALVALTLSIALVNLWNRLNITTSQVADADWS